MFKNVKWIKRKVGVTNLVSVVGLRNVRVIVQMKEKILGLITNIDYEIQSDFHLWWNVWSHDQNQPIRALEFIKTNWKQSNSITSQFIIHIKIGNTQNYVCRLDWTCWTFSNGRSPNLNTPSQGSGPTQGLNFEVSEFLVFANPNISSLWVAPAG